MDVPSPHGVRVQTGVAHRVEDDAWVVIVRLSRYQHGVLIETIDEISDPMPDEAFAELTALEVARQIRAGIDPERIVEFPIFRNQARSN